MFLGIDVGTFETKGVLVDRDGTVHARAQRRHGIDTPHPGHVEHDPEAVWWHDLASIARELTRHPEAARLEGVGVSAIGPCIVATDAQLTPLRNAILYGVDTRASEHVAEITNRLGVDAIRERTGNTLTSQSAGPKIAWLREHEPDVWRAARWFMTSQSWLVARLTGNVTIDHATAGYFHPLYDLAAGMWSVEGCEDFIDEERLPRLGWSTDIAGLVTREAAAATGIPVGTPVIVGTADAPAEAVGSGVVDDGELMAMYGSSGYFIRVGDRPISADALWAAPFVFPGSYVLAAGTSTAGTATRWIADALSITADDDAATFGALLELAAQSERGARGVLALPHFAGERTPFHDPATRATFAGLSLEHTRADLARAMLEGIGHSIAAAVNAIRDADAPISRAVAVGGATKNPYIIDAVSTITGIDQTIVDSPGASVGDAFLAAVATGAIAERGAARGWAAVRHIVSPDQNAVAAFARDHADFLSLYAATSHLHKKRAGYL